MSYVDETELKSTNLVFHEMTTSKQKNINIRIDTAQEAIPDKDATQKVNAPQIQDFQNFAEQKCCTFRWPSFRWRKVAALIALTFFQFKNSCVTCRNIFTISNGIFPQSRLW